MTWGYFKLNLRLTFKKPPQILWMFYACVVVESPNPTRFFRHSTELPFLWLFPPIYGFREDTPDQDERLLLGLRHGLRYFPYANGEWHLKSITSPCCYGLHFGLSRAMIIAFGKMPYRKQIRPHQLRHAENMIDPKVTG